MADGSDNEPTEVTPGATDTPQEQPPMQPALLGEANKGADEPTPNGEQDAVVKPVWRTALEISLNRGFVSEADLVRVYAALAADRQNTQLRDLLERVLTVYQERQGQIEDLFITPGEKWAVIRTVNHRPNWLPFFRASTIDTVFDIEAAKPAAAADVFTALSDLSVKSDHVLRGTDQVSFAKELGFAFQNLVGQVCDANSQPLPAGDVAALEKEVTRLNSLWISAAKRGLPVTTLEGMGIGLAVVALLAALIALLLNPAKIADLRASTFVAVAIAGAIGAIISVLTRMSAGTFRVPIETARTNVRFLGSIRPVIGAVFAVVIVFGLIGQLLGLQTVNDQHRFYAYFVFAFVAGFSERWARNLLAGVAGGLETDAPKPPTSTRRRPTAPADDPQDDANSRPT